MGAASGSATILASERAGSPAGSRAPKCPKIPQNEANLAPPPKTVDLDQPPGGCAAPTTLQPSLQAVSTSDGGERLKPLPTSSLESLSPDTNALHVTPALNPAPCTTRDPRWAWKRLGNGYARDSAGKARHERRRFARRGRGGRPGVMLEEAEDHDDVPVKVDDADEDDQVQ
jgi:hypothetical protein